MKKWLITLVCLLLYSASAWALPVYDNSTGATVTLVTSIEATVVVGGGCANPVLYAHLGFGDKAIGISGDVTTTAGIMTQVAATDSLDGYYTLMSFRRAGTTGSQLVHIDFAAQIYSAVLIVASYCNTDQTTPEGTPTTLASSDVDLSLDVPSGTTQLATMVFFEPTTSDAVTVDGSQTDRLQYSGDAGLIGISDKTGSATATMAATMAANNYWVMHDVSLLPATAAAVAVRRRAILQ